VLLEVRADNVPALALYATRDFERISVRRGYYDAGRVDALVLRKRLPRR
jgi:ribosomal-protein-alanine N-acetyltransferase